MTYRCEDCHQELAEWATNCYHCGGTTIWPWNSKPKVRDDFAPLASSPSQTSRLTTGSAIIDNFLGGGIPRNHETIIYGKGSSGKTAFLMEIVRNGDGNVLWATAEEPTVDVDARAVRFGQDMPLERVWRFNTDDIDHVVQRFHQRKPDMIAIDSWNKFSTRSIDRPASSKRQMMYILVTLHALSQKHNCAVVMLAQADADGYFAGDHKLIHEVHGAVLRLSHPKNSDIRTLRIDKSRYCKDGKIRLKMDDKGRLIPFVVPKDEPDDDDNDGGTTLKSSRTQSGKRSGSKSSKSRLSIVK